MSDTPETPEEEEGEEVPAAVTLEVQGVTIAVSADDE